MYLRLAHMEINDFAFKYFEILDCFAFSLGVVVLLVDVP
jgi:hypothetical protein